MAKRKRYKVGEVIDFNWAGATERGEIIRVTSEGKMTVDDGKYTYPIYADQVINVIK